MNPFIQQFLNQKINSLTSDELIKHGQTYNIKLTTDEAIKIINILKSEPYIDINDNEQHRKIIKKIGKEINLTLARKANDLLNQFKKRK